MSRFAPALVAAVVCVTLVGCGDAAKPSPVPAGGKVTFKKTTPAAGALVVFHPTDPAVEKKFGKPVGTVGEDGTFKLTTYEKDDGAPEGEYGVTVDWRAKGKMGGISLTEGGGGGAPKLNAKFSNPQQPFTKVTVKKGADNQFTFEVD